MGNVKKQILEESICCDDYLKLYPLWNKSLDAYEGTASIKSDENSKIYLVPQRLEQNELDKTSLSLRYSSTRYYTRLNSATFPNVYKPIVDDLTGLMQKNAPNVAFGVNDDTESSEDVQKLNKYGNSDADTLVGLKSRVNFNQVLFGKYGLLLDIFVDENGMNPEFNISEYSAYSIVNGEMGRRRDDADEELLWALLDERTNVFDRRSKRWFDYPRLRLIGLDANGEYYQALIEGNDYLSKWQAFDILNPQGKVFYPSFKGRRLNFIPFTVCNYDRLGFGIWQKPPYVDVAQIAIDYYVVDSWHKTALYNCATPTLAVFNSEQTDENLRLGGVLYFSDGKGEAQSSAKMIETSGAGLAEMRFCKQALIDSLRYSSIRDLLNGAGANSSAEAMKVRVSPGTAVIAAVDNCGSRAIEEQLMFASMWSGATKEEAARRISFTSDTNYFPNDIQLQAVVSLIEANQSTRTLSKKNVFALIDKTVPGTFTSYEDNEEQLFSEEKEIKNDNIVQISANNVLNRSNASIDKQVEKV